MTVSTRILSGLGLSLLLAFSSFAGAQQPDREAPAAEGPPTVIESDHLKMTTLEEETRFIFSENVKVTTTDMTVFCDRLEVFAGRQDGSEEPAPAPATEDPAEDEMSKLGRIDRIHAIGNVRILQEDREATSGRAEVFPQEGRVVLTENPILRNEQGKVSGGRITFYQGEREAVVESGSRVELPSIPALGADADKRSNQNGQSND